MFKFIRTHFRKITVLLIIAAFSFQFSGKISDVVGERSTCVCSYDGYGYYMYLTQAFQHHDLLMKQEEIQHIQDTYCDSAYAYQLHRMDNGNSVNIYHIGQAYLELPAYTVGHIFAKALDYPGDGFSKPYHIAYLLNALLFILLGLYFLDKILRMFFSEQLGALLLLIVYFGTNFWATAVHAYQLQHIYLFALVAFLFYTLLRFRANPDKKKFLLLAALTLGLISSVRPTHVLLIVLPLFMLKGIFSSRGAYWKAMLWFPLGGLLFNLPQMLYWKIVGGSWFILNLHVEEVIIVDPHLLDFLFSYKKGWLLYTPVFLLLVPGFIRLYKQRKELFGGILSTLLLCIWVFSSWECWWYASSLGSRVMVDLYPLLVLPVGFGLLYLAERKWTLWLAGLFVALTSVLAIFQTVQFSAMYLHPDRMAKAHYWYIFGKLSMPGYRTDRLEIDRSDLHWPEQIKARELGFGSVEETVFCELNNLKAKANTSTLLDKRAYFPGLKTDETLLEAQVIYQNQDSLRPGEINFETFSKYNVYSWNEYTLDSQKEEGSTDTLTVRFNLPVINHRGDRIQVYVVNPSGKEIIIESLRIKAYSLIRE